MMRFLPVLFLSLLSFAAPAEADTKRQCAIDSMEIYCNLLIETFSRFERDVRQSVYDSIGFTKVDGLNVHPDQLEVEKELFRVLNVYRSILRESKALISDQNTLQGFESPNVDPATVDVFRDEIAAMSLDFEEKSIEANSPDGSHEFFTILPNCTLRAEQAELQSFAQRFIDLCE